MRSYRVVDMHTEGEPVRIVVAGHPVVEGATILDKRRDAETRFDHIRRTLMLEPRGHAGMYGVIPVSPSAGADLAVLFTHNSGFSTMCGHAVIAVGRWAVEQRLVTVTRPVTRFVLECPCGPVQVEVTVDEGGTPRAVAFESVPAWVEATDLDVRLAGDRRVRLDVAFGGAFYAVLPACRLGLSLRATKLAGLVEAACEVTASVRAALPLDVPGAPDLGFLYGTILTDDAAPGVDPITANLCVFGEGQVDRSPTGSGVTARLALERARGRIGPGDEWRFRGPSGGEFGGAVLRDVAAHGRPAIVARVSGWAHHMGTAEIVAEDGDPLAGGLDALGFA